jgi:hypothetical protein
MVFPMQTLVQVSIGTAYIFSVGRASGVLTRNLADGFKYGADINEYLVGGFKYERNIHEGERNILKCKTIGTIFDGAPPLIKAAIFAGTGANGSPLAHHLSLPPKNGTAGPRCSPTQMLVQVSIGTAYFLLVGRANGAPAGNLANDFKMAPTSTGGRLRPFITLLFLPFGRVGYLLEKWLGLLLGYLFQQSELVCRRWLSGLGRGLFSSWFDDAHIVQGAKEFKQHLVTIFVNIKNKLLHIIDLVQK